MVAIIYTKGCLACINKLKYREIKLWALKYNYKLEFRNVFINHDWLNESYAILKHNKTAEYPLVIINGVLVK